MYLYYTRQEKIASIYEEIFRISLIGFFLKRKSVDFMYMGGYDVIVERQKV